MHYSISLRQYMVSRKKGWILWFCFLLRGEWMDGCMYEWFIMDGWRNEYEDVCLLEFELKEDADRPLTGLWEIANSKHFFSSWPNCFCFALLLLLCFFQLYGFTDWPEFKKNLEKKNIKTEKKTSSCISAWFCSQSIFHDDVTTKIYMWE